MKKFKNGVWGFTVELRDFCELGTGTLLLKLGFENFLVEFFLYDGATFIGLIKQKSCI